MGGKKFIPGPDAEFDVFFSKYCQIVSQKTTGESPAWTHIPTARITELFAVAGAWHTAYTKLLGPHTSADVLAKNQARKAAEKILEEFNNQYILYAREVTDAERVEIGTHVHDKVRTTVKKPSCQPTQLVRHRQRAPGRGLRRPHLLGHPGQTVGKRQVPHRRHARGRRRPSPLHLHPPQEVPL
ncbi:MAG: hypothetical protein LBS57_07360 [Treponema sp.]|jgi:hypothetical protein|nr:hypothetical protein [Treponema sp.]